MSSETPPDRTGAATAVTGEPGQFTIEVDGRTVGLTEAAPDYRGRGLATILVAEALRRTRAAGLRVVPQCWMVAEFTDKHPAYATSTDRV